MELLGRFELPDAYRCAAVIRRDPLRFAALNVPYGHGSAVRIPRQKQNDLRPKGHRSFWSCWADSNCRPHPYQGCALPTELQQHTCPRMGASQVATEKGLEPSTSSVTGWRSNLLNYSATGAFIKYQIIRPMSISFFDFSFLAERYFYDIMTA